MMENEDDTHMAAKLSGDPIRPRYNAISHFAISSTILVLPLRSWEYALLIVTTCWHYHLCASLQYRTKLFYAQMMSHT